MCMQARAREFVGVSKDLLAHTHTHTQHTELDHLFLALGHKSKRGEVEDMIWEVDEDCDGCINWFEFQNLYTRGRDDKTGYEPRGLFNVVEFVMNDKEGAGFITLEEAMQIMYLRYGRWVGGCVLT